MNTFHTFSECTCVYSGGSSLVLKAALLEFLVQLAINTFFALFMFAFFCSEPNFGASMKLFFKIFFPINLFKSIYALGLGSQFFVVLKSLFHLAKMVYEAKNTYTSLY